MVPVWTHAASTSDAMRSSSLPKRRQHIVPARMEDCAAPFAGVYRCRLHEAGRRVTIQQCCNWCESWQLILPTRSRKRLRSIGDGRLGCPALFMSVSRRTRRRSEPLPAVRSGAHFGADAVLVSAYDLLPARRDNAILLDLSIFAARADSCWWTPVTLRQVSERLAGHSKK